ncbi:MAG: M56 family metallopeptidase [Verrucomicrobiota bacterium]
MPPIAGAWLAGVLILSGRKAGGLVVLRRLRRRGVTAPDDALREIFARACRTLGFDPARVPLKVSSLAEVPLAMGWLRPVVLFPASLLTGLGPGEIELLLAHELAHIRRGDYLINLLQSAVEIVFFYHPVTWWISRRMRRERENACDDLVTAHSGETLAYAKALLRLETLREPAGKLASAATGGGLLRRIERLAGESPARAGGGPVPVVLAVMAGLGVLALMKAYAATPDKAPATMTEAEAKQKGIAAIIDGHVITIRELKQQWQAVEDSARANLDGEALRKQLEILHNSVLHALVERHLIIDDFRAHGTIPRSATDERIADIIKDQYGGDRAAFLRALAQRGESLDRLRESIEENAIVGYERNKHVDVPAWDYFQQHLELFPQETWIKVSVIAIPWDDGVRFDPNSDNPRRREALQALDQLQHGADFATVADKYKARYFFPDGQSTSWITETGPCSVQLPALWAAVEKLSPGQVSGIFEGGWFYGIARVEERRAAVTAQTPAGRTQETALINGKTKEIEDTWLDGLRAKAQIQTFPAVLAIDDSATLPPGSKPVPAGP